MISANELRLGNIFYLKRRRGFFTVEEIRPNHIRLIRENVSDSERFPLDMLMPVPLNHVIVTKYGFRPYSEGWSLDAWSEDCKIDLDYKAEGEILFKSRYEPERQIRLLPTVKYLHQLQNLYFD